MPERMLSILPFPGQTGLKAGNAQGTQALTASVTRDHAHADHVHVLVHLPSVLGLKQGASPALTMLGVQFWDMAAQSRPPLSLSGQSSRARERQYPGLLRWRGTVANKNQAQWRLKALKTPALPL